MRRFDKASLIKKILKDVLRLTLRLAGIGAECLIAFFFKIFIPFFIGSIACFALTCILLNGIGTEAIETATTFAKETLSSPLSLLPLYAQWYDDVFENGFRTSSRYFLSQVLPAVPLFYAAFGIIGMLLLRPAASHSREGRRARLDFIDELFHHIKEQKRGFSDEEFFTRREEAPELERDAFEEEIFGEDENEDVSAALKVLYISDDVKIFGKESLYDEWADKTRLAVVFCTPKEANGFFLQAFYASRLKNRDCRALKGFFRDMKDADAAEEVKKIQAGVFDSSRYDKITFWERPPLSWRKAKVMFCMIPKLWESKEK